jgi:ubiquinone/menaquinone biosynthesis C-methylase UbiE
MRDYDVFITRGHSPTNDAVFDWMKPRIQGRYIDVGCNVGVLLEEVPNGVGIDRSPLVLEQARKKGLDVHLASAEELPFDDGEFDTAVLSGVLNQCDNPETAITEALRVARRIIGYNPLPGGRWGVIRDWTRSIVPADTMIRYGCVCSPFDENHYWFETAEER